MDQASAPARASARPLLLAGLLVTADVLISWGSARGACPAVFVPWTGKLGFLAAGLCAVALSAFAGLRTWRCARDADPPFNRDSVAWGLLCAVAALNGWAALAFTFGGSACLWALFPFGF